jgi:8-oxo-dGTP pyrophosphatase MutT (NUDIX family)
LRNLARKGQHRFARTTPAIVVGVGGIAAAIAGSSVNMGIATVPVEQVWLRVVVGVLGLGALAIATLLAIGDRSRVGDLPRQVAAVPYRLVDGEPKLRLVKTTGGRWTFPKGGLEAGLTESAAAEKEAWEEAGVRGAIDERPFADYIHQKREWKSSGNEFLVSAYLMKVSHEEDPQEPARDPQWLSPEKAVEYIRDGRSFEHQKELERVIAEADRIIRARAATTADS